MASVELIPIDQTGSVPIDCTPCHEMLKQCCDATGAFYKVVGFELPWIGYVSVSEGRPVGGGGFKGPPQDNRVEIAYFTLPELEGRGFASATARALIAIAKRTSPGIAVAAQTLPTPNASNALLRKLGFVLTGTAVDDEVGEVWEWQLNESQGE